MASQLPQPRSSCPIASALDIVGDRWTLVILRDILLAGKRSFSDLASPEGIATNVLSDRLARLETAGVLVKEPDPADGRRRLYVPTEQGWDLLPVILELAIYGKDHCGGTAHADMIELARTDRAALIARFQK